MTSCGLNYDQSIDYKIIAASLHQYKENWALVVVFNFSYNENAVFAFLLSKLVLGWIILIGLAQR